MGGSPDGTFHRLHHGDDFDYVDVEGDQHHHHHPPMPPPTPDPQVKRPRGRPRKKVAPSLEEGLLHAIR